MKIAFRIKGKRQFRKKKPVTSTTTQVEYEIAEENVNFDSDSIEIVDSDNGAIIGRIFSPAGTLGDVPNAIQVCGFDMAYCLMGCGVVEGDDKLHKKDIQLLFQPRKSDYKRPHGIGDCWKCFNKKEDCSCDEHIVFPRIENVEKFIAKKERYRWRKEIVKGLKDEI